MISSSPRSYVTRIGRSPRPSRIATYPSHGIAERRSRCSVGMIIGLVSLLRSTVVTRLLLRSTSYYAATRPGSLSAWKAAYANAHDRDHHPELPCPSDPHRRLRVRLPLPRRPGPSARPGRDAVPQGPHARHPRLRRRVQRRRQPRRLLRPEDRHLHGDGQLPPRRAGAGARPRDGRHAVLQAVRARRRPRAEHRHRLQRSRPRRPRADRLLQPRQRGRRPAQARRLRLEGDLRRGRALVPLRRHLRGALRNDVRAHHRGDEGRARRPARSCRST